jgi:hypothetical protein
MKVMREFKKSNNHFKYWEESTVTIETGNFQESRKHALRK